MSVDSPPPKIDWVNCDSWVPEWRLARESVLIGNPPECKVKYRPRQLSKPTSLYCVFLDTPSDCGYLVTCRYLLTVSFWTRWVWGVYMIRPLVVGGGWIILGECFFGWYLVRDIWVGLCGEGDGVN